jgi:hypothetical protein
VLFAGIYPGIEFLTTFGEYSKADSLPDALNVSALSVDVVMVIAAIGVFILGSWMEKKCQSSSCETSI